MARIGFCFSALPAGSEIAATAERQQPSGDHHGGIFAAATEDFEFKQVRCSLPLPPPAEDYSSILGGKVVFGAAQDELIFDERWLSKTLRRTNAITSAMLEKRAPNYSTACSLKKILSAGSRQR